MKDAMLNHGLDRMIQINEHGVYILFRGPFPPAMIELAEKQKTFSSRRVMLQWLGIVWPSWRSNVVKCQGLNWQPTP